MATKKNQYRAQPLAPIDFEAAMGRADEMLAGAAATQVAEPRGAARAVADTAVQFGKGAVTGVRMMSDVFGADNAMSGGLRSVDDALNGLLSATAKQDQAQVAAIMQEAEGKGWLEQIGLGLKAAGVAPGALLAQAAGTAIPTIAASLATGGAGPMATAARFAAPALMGGAQGVGATKGAIYDTTKQELLKAGASPEEAEARAMDQQSYGGDSSGQIALGGALGVVAGSTGMERAVAGLRGGVSKAAPGIMTRMGVGGLTEAVPELAQGGQEKYATNSALNNEGFKVDPMSGVVANATMEGVAGYGMGAAFGIPNPGTEAEPGAPAPATPQEPTLQIGNTPDPMIITRDGTIARRSEFDAYVNGLPPDQQAAARANLMGLAPQPSPANQLRATKVPEAGPMSAAVNAGIEGQAQDIESGKQAAIDLNAANEADQAAYAQAMAQQQEQAAVQAQEQDSIDKPVTSGVIPEAQMSEEDKRAVLFSNQPVLDGGEKYTGTKDGDVLNGLGAPFKTKMAALRRAQMEGKDWTIAGVFDGWVARRKDSIEQDTAQGTNTTPVEAPGEAPQAVAGNAAATGELSTEGSGALEGVGVTHPAAQAKQAQVATESVATEKQISNPLPEPKWWTDKSEGERFLLKKLHGFNNEDASWSAMTDDQQKQVADNYAEFKSGNAKFDPAGIPALFGIKGQPKKRGEQAANTVARQERIDSTLKNGGHVVGNKLRMSNGMTQMILTDDELSAIPDSSKRAAPNPDDARIKPSGMPAAPTGAPIGVTPAAPALTKKEQAKADLDHLFSVDDKRAKAIERIAKGTAYFSNPLKAGDFIAKNGLKDTHQAVQTNKTPGKLRWDIQAKSQPTESANVEAPQAIKAKEEGPKAPAAPVAPKKPVKQRIEEARQGRIEAHPVVDGKPVVNRDSVQRWATTDAVRGANPEYRTDIVMQPTVANPVHQDPGQAPEVATAPVVAKSIAKAASNEDKSQKEMRLWLLGEIDKAVKLTEDYADYQQKIKEYGQSVADGVFYGKANGSIGLNAPQGNSTVTFDVPGDGKFKIRNSLRGLMEFRAKVEGKSSTGFTDKLTKPKGLPASTGVAKGSSNQIEALSAMLEELDFEAAVDYARETGVSLNDAKVPPHIRDQFKAYLKDGTLPPAPFSPTRYWEYQASSRADKDGNPIREASLTKEIGADTYIANVTGTNATGFTFTVTKGNETFEKKSGTFRTFSDALQGAESKISSIQPKVFKPKDTGWNMRGTGYAGKRYIGRNITLDDGREVVARIYENAGQYEEAEVKVDGARVFAKTDRYKAEKLADDFIKTLEQKAPVNETQQKFEAEQATKKTEPIEADKPIPAEVSDEPIPAVTEAQARKQFEWRNMGQKDGTKSHMLFFFESPADKGTGASLRRGEVSLYPGASGWKIEDGDGTPYKSLADAKAAAIDAAIPKLQEQGYVLKPAQAATAILDAANITGKERVEALKDVKKGDITPEELEAAYPAKPTAKTVEYPLAPAGTRYEESTIAPTMMTPDEFLSRVRPLEVDDVARDNIDDLKAHIQSGKTLDPLNIYADGKEDGRHRAIAAKELGIAQVPVILHGQAVKNPAIIEDTGVKLGGARKDQAPSLKTELSDDDISSQPLSKIWPSDEYLAIDDTFASAVAFVARQEVPSKPRAAHRVAQWVKNLKTVRHLAQMISGGEVTQERFAAKVGESPGLRNFMDKVVLLEAIDRSQWPRISSVEVYKDSYMYAPDGIKVSKPLVRVVIDDKTRSFDGATSVADVVERVSAMLDTEVKQDKRMQFEVRGTEKKGYGINKKGDKEYRRLKTFPTAKEAFAYIAGNYDDVVALWDGVKERDNVKEDDVRNSENRPRAGADHRQGKDVSAEQFNATFGFRGIEFGNWVSQGKNAKERQGMLNQAYDALRDLADIVGVPPKAMSLNGSLGLGFGSRGSGKFAAHFEPDTLVINLTKTRGAGSLAHEWLHAMDNYFARQRHDGQGVSMKDAGNTQDGYRKANYVTYKPEPLYVHKTKMSTPITKAKLESYAASSGSRGQPGGYYDPANWHIDPKHPQGVRPEVERRFAELVEALDASPMATRASMNDKAPDGYWGRIIERAARSFENYVISKMLADGYQNDYLANVRDVQDFQRDAGRYPYLLPEEVAPIAEAFDNLFGTIQTKETEQGIAMFSQEQASQSDRTLTVNEGNREKTNRLQSVIKKQGHDFTITPAALPVNVADDAGERAKGSSPKNSFALAERIASVFGKEIVWFTASGPFTINGVVVPGGLLSKQVFINANAKHPAHVVLGHELTHHMEKDAPGAYKALVKSITGLLRNHDKYRALYGIEGATDEFVVKEMLGDLMGDNFDKREFWNLVAKETNGTYFRIIANSISKWLTGLLTKLKQNGLGSHQFVTDVQEARSMLAKAVAEYSKVTAPTATDSGAAALSRRASSTDQTQTEAFKAWFGGSSVTNWDDSPQVVYHGSPSKFTSFDAGLAGSRSRPETDIKGIYFSPDKATAEVWGANVMPVYLKIENPYFVNGRIDATDEDRARVSGHDGIIQNGGGEYVVFNPTQIKSATDNTGAFDAENPDIRYSVAGGINDSMMGKPLTEKQFYSQYAQHIDLRGRDGSAAATRESILRDGFKKGVNVNAMPPYRGGAPKNISDKQFMPKKGDVVYLAPKGTWKDRPNGMEIQNGWMPKPYEAVTVSEDGASMYQEYLKAFGESSETNPDIRYSRMTGTIASAANNVREVKLPAGYLVGDLINSVPGKLNWWHKSVGTQYNLAQRSKPFKRVFDAVQSFLNDVSFYATEAADLAPNILPKLETWKDIAKSPLSPADAKAISAPIFEGTLNWARDESGKAVKMEVLEAAAAKLTIDQKSQRLLRGNHITGNVLKMWRGLPVVQYEAMITSKYEGDMLKAGLVFTDAELKSLFNLTDKQIPLYREFRKATDKSLTNLAIADMLRFGGDDVAPIRDAVLESKDVTDAADALAKYLRSLADMDPERSAVLMDTADKMIDKGDKAADLMARGYAPLSRFGRYTLDVVDENGERVYFGMFESQFEAAKMNRQMKAQFPGAVVTQGTVSEQAYKLFAGVSPETLELFGDMLGLESTGDGAANEAFQTYLKLSKSSRSAMKRLIQRKGIAGFNEDAGRVLAGFVYSNARQTASSLHMGEMTKAATDKDAFRNQGELQDSAVKLVDYIKNPQEEAQALRGLLFAQYIGGSVASAMVNMTQPLTMTFPWLSQFGGATGAAKQMASAMKDSGKKLTGNVQLDAALKRAEEDGTVSPQEVHQLMQQANGRGALSSGDGTRAGNAMATANNTLSRITLAWGKLFSVAEQFNRRVTFIAAYRTAVEQKMEDPDAFARRAVNETQGIYNKGNKPSWARGAIGGTLFTFKQYSISYVEMLQRMSKNGPEGKKAALLALGVLFLMAGAGGMPGADDLDDLISGAMQSMGYNFDSKSKRKEFFVSLLGEGGANFMERGVSGLPGVPIDVSGRMGLGNLIPGTGLFTKKVDHTRDVAEFAGPAGDLIKRSFEAGGKLLTGEVGAAVQTISPKAVQNVAQSYDMANMGMYRDAKGMKVLDTNGYDAVAKLIGFQPNDVKRAQDASFEVQRMIGLNRINESEIANKWALGMFEKNPAKVQEARDDLKAWNEANPESRIVIKFPQIMKRVSNMRQSKAERIAKTSPKEIRAAVRQELEASR